MTKKFHGCNEDCLNCTYKDCLKPDNLCKSDSDCKEAFKIGSGVSQTKMYTLELGGYGGNTPNISRKFLL